MTKTSGQSRSKNTPGRSIEPCVWFLPKVSLISRLSSTRNSLPFHWGAGLSEIWPFFLVYGPARTATRGVYSRRIEFSVSALFWKTNPAQGKVWIAPQLQMSNLVKSVEVPYGTTPPSFEGTFPQGKSLSSLGDKGSPTTTVRSHIYTQ